MQGITADSIRSLAEFVGEDAAREKLKETVAELEAFADELDGSGTDPAR